MPLFSRTAVSNLVTAITLGAAGTAQAADLTVEVKGISADKGTVMVALYKASDTWMKKSSFGTATPARATGSMVQFKNLEEGVYAVSLYVDENDNGKMDTNVIGIPTEPYAFSNNAVGNFGPPNFEQAKFTIGKDNKTIVINLK